MFNEKTKNNWKRCLAKKKEQDKILKQVEKHRLEKEDSIRRTTISRSRKARRNQKEKKLRMTNRLFVDSKSSKKFLIVEAEELKKYSKKAGQTMVQAERITRKTSLEELEMKRKTETLGKLQLQESKNKKVF